MAQKANLTTLRLNKYFLNLSNLNIRFYLIGFNFLKDFKQLMLIKDVLITNENCNLFCNKLFIKCDLYFRVKKLKTFKKNKKKKTKKINKNLTENFFKLSQNLTKTYKLTSCVTNFTVLNKKVNKKLNILLFKKIKFFKNFIFSRRFYLFLDFLNLTSLYIVSKINLQLYLFCIVETFRYLQKKNHRKFFEFIKLVLRYVIKLSSKKCQKLKIKGIFLLIKGKLKGSLIASNHRIKLGKMPAQSLHENVEFAKAHIFTKKFGVFGIKLWVFKK